MPDKQNIEYVAISPDCRHIAIAAKNGDGAELFVDGKSLAVADAISYVAYSPDSMHLLWTRTTAKKVVLVADGGSGLPFDQIANAQFSRDGGHIYYAGRRDRDWFAVLDGRETSTGNAAPSQVVLSKDGSHIAYVIRDGDYQRVVVDGIAGDPYWEIAGLTGSDDSAHLAFFANTDWQKWETVFDGKSVAGGFYDVENLVMTPDGRRLAFVGLGPAGLDGPDQYVVVVDGSVKGPYSKVTLPPVFSPGGKHVTYAIEATLPADPPSARIEHDFRSIEDGANGPFLNPRGLVYDSTGTHSAWDDVNNVMPSGDLRATEYSVRVDGNILLNVAGRNLTISPDGGSIAWTAVYYTAHGAIAGAEVAAGPLGPQMNIEEFYSGIHCACAGPPLFSRDSRHVAYCAQRIADQPWTMILDNAVDEEAGLIYPSVDSSLDGQWLPITEFAALRSIENGRAYRGQYPYQFAADGTLVFFRSNNGRLQHVRWKPNGPGLAAAATTAPATRP